MLNRFRQQVIKFIESDKDYPFIAAIASGLYPLAYYYYSNFSLLNSWSQFLYFIVYFLLIPIVSFKIIYVIFNRISKLKNINKFILPVLNFSWSVFLLVVMTKGYKLKIIFFSILCAIIIAVLLKNFFKKIVVFQLLLAFVILVLFIKFLVFENRYEDKWLKQPDDIEQVVLKKRPNIYFIQPDGYANSSELKRGYYNFDNSEFESYLTNKEFKIYNDYRSNYYSTLSSNSSMFAMQHHFYNFPTSRIREVFNARDVIAGNNPVFNILKANNYESYLLLDKSYLLINRPRILFDYCNMKLEDVAFFSRDYQLSRDIFQDFKSLDLKRNNKPKFFFLEELSPSHVTNNKSPGNVAESERKKYLNRLQETNDWLKQIINYILEIDKNSLIIIAADHGGFVGMNTTYENRTKITDRDLIYSIFTSQLAIKWPDKAPEYDTKIKTSVNLFRILFTYLSENEEYLNNLQEDVSYIQIERGAPFGVYEYLDENGNVVFNKLID